MNKRLIIGIISVIILIYLLFRLSITDLFNNQKISVQFTTENSHEVPVIFSVFKKQINVTIGELSENNYSFENLTADSVFFRPIHQLIPSKATNYYKMIKCFCYDDIMLQPNEKIELPLAFLFSSDIPKDMDTIKINYNLVRRLKSDVLFDEE